MAHPAGGQSQPTDSPRHGHAAPHWAVRDDVWVPRRLAFRTHLFVVLVLAAYSLAGCSASSGQARGIPTPAVTLPPGDLVNLVPRPEEVPTGLVPLLAQTGPADLARIAGFSSDKTKAAATLARHGFRAGYVVEYAEPSTGRVLTVVVTRFATVRGATEDLAADLVAPIAPGAKRLALGVVGAASGAVTQPRPSAPKGAELVTVRFRVDDTTWVVAVGSFGPVDAAAVQSIASALAARARVAASISPSASAS